MLGQIVGHVPLAGFKHINRWDEPDRFKRYSRGLALLGGVFAVAGSVALLA
ncbi:hypothetical protein ACFQPG_00170 [Sphingomonas sp. GCM10030256]|uniref:hypothetical protein n=1 Tax=Sphingomonas sp. GCM10030256 TaxID=3273427 RepID=UPI00361B32B2